MPRVRVLLYRGAWRGRGIAVAAQAIEPPVLAQAIERKIEIRMALGGRAWRGYFPVGGELTSGRPDLKEGLYFGTELDEQHSLVKA